MNNITREVFSILMKSEKAREDDMFLYCKIAEARECAHKPLADVLLNLKEFDMPPFETVRRSRQKVQEMRPDLKPGAEAQMIRDRLEEEYRDFARC